MIQLALYDEAGNCIVRSKQDAKVHMRIQRKYLPGDRILIDTEKKQFISVKLDASIETAMLYTGGGRFEFVIPFGEERMPYPYGAFEGEYHILEVNRIDPSESKESRDLSTNPLDIRSDMEIYPHCTASVETRGESIFAARNTIDGMKETDGHGIWPFTSWGDNEDPAAEIRIDFGRNVIVEKLVINLRSDFPHDNYWKNIDIVVGDEYKMTVQMGKTGEDQCFDIGGVIADYVKLCRLVKDDCDPSPFPALTHWRVLGRECEDTKGSAEMR